MDRDTLESTLSGAFDAESETCRVVSRQAQDLADAGVLREDLGVELSPEYLVSELREAPADTDLAERWNWWLDSLELSQGGYRRFKIRADRWE